ncbi:uncharacterized protein LOC114528620 [Dendronephthya gigantea]|uniref:uncharacterized protein LOC114528620 n=1 Tax=Dendronephthya gigantea TaxID=151771 RepID=UPI00106D5205|nr:uncharacterized protein LOC114528620 [Dendronephthya gigantea]
MFVLGLFLIFCGVLNAASLSGTALSHTVMLTFLNITLDTWKTDAKESIMKETIANLTTDYCQGNANKCDVSSSSTSTRFKPENVKMVSGYPKNTHNDLKMLVFVELPGSSGRISGDALLTIVRNGKANLSSEIGYEIGSVVSGESLSGSEEKEINHKWNKIMIPLAFLILLAIALICWILHRRRKKKLARDEVKRYQALKNSKNKGSNSRNKAGAMVTTADDLPSEAFHQKPTDVPELNPPENQAVIEANNNVRRHKKKRSLPKKPPVKKTSDDDSDDVFDDDPDVREKPKKKGRRRKGRRSYDFDRDNKEEYEMQAAKVLACSPANNEGTNGVSHENSGYQRDSEKGESDPARNSNTDSAVELNSSVASSRARSARTLPPIPKTN